MNKTDSLLQELMVEVEGKKGLRNNPDFFLDMEKILKNNAFAKGINNHALTQILWEAKDKALDDVLSLIKSKRRG